MLSDEGVINNFIFSSPYKVMMSIKGLLVSGELYIHVLTTLKEIMLSFTIGSLLGFILAVIFYLVPFLKRVMDPYLTLLNSLPKVSLGPILIIWLGANMKSIVVMSLLINVIVTLVTIYNGLITTDAYKIKMFKSFGASTYQIMTKLVIASNKRTIFSSLKLNISMSLIGVIMGEFLVSKAGIGYLILYGTQVFNLTLVMAKFVMNPKTLQYLLGHSDISVTMNVYTHIRCDDAEEELKRMEEFSKAQGEVEQKNEKPMSQKMFNVI